MKILPNKQEWRIRYQSMTLRQKIFWSVYFLYSLAFMALFLLPWLQGHSHFSLVCVLLILHCLLIWTLSPPAFIFTVVSILAQGYFCVGAIVLLSLFWLLGWESGDSTLGQLVLWGEVIAIPFFLLVYQIICLFFLLKNRRLFGFS